MHYFAWFATVSTFFLIALGGLVTSHEAGMAVPDWPTSFGYNMFALPFDRWTGGVFWEHSHRVLASVVGLLTVILAVWIIVCDGRRWVKVLGVVAVIAVVIQGVLGGLRVTLIENQLGIFHGMLAQAFFLLLGVLVVVTSPAWLRGRWVVTRDAGGLRWEALAVTGLIFLTLGIAATMRHAHAGLSIPDFPLAYGQVLPDTSAAALDQINAERFEQKEKPTTAGLIWLQMAHRFVAVLIAFGVGWLAWRGGRVSRAVRLWTRVLVGMVIVQIVLGAFTIWTNKAADVATAHMALGALTLFLSGLLTFRLMVMRHQWEARRLGDSDGQSAPSVSVVTAE
ncbi:MAG: COX15/CtaA family protein [Chthoniobacterales bacterium]